MAKTLTDRQIKSFWSWL